MKVILSSQAEKELKKLSKINQIAIARKIRGIRDSIKAEGEEKLKGFQDIFRIRVGDYRLVYRKSKNRVYIVLIRHTKDVYRLVRQLFR